MIAGPALAIAALFSLGGDRRARLVTAGIALAPILLVFGVMMAIAIAGMVIAMYVRGLALDPVPTIAMAVVATACAVVVTALLRRLHA